MWQLLEEVADYPDGEPFHHHPPHQRVYGWKGEQWPKLVITLYGGDPLAVTHDPVVGEEPFVGLKLSCSAQKSPEHWWHDDYPIPVELLPDLIQLLESYPSGV